MLRIRGVGVTPEEEWYIQYTNTQGWNHKDVPKNKALKVFHMLKDLITWHIEDTGAHGTLWTFVERR